MQRCNAKVDGASAEVGLDDHFLRASRIRYLHAIAIVGNTRYFSTSGDNRAVRPPQSVNGVDFSVCEMKCDGKRRLDARIAVEVNRCEYPDVVLRGVCEFADGPAALKVVFSDALIGPFAPRKVDRP